MPTCQICGKSGLTLKVANCKFCHNLICSDHWYFVPVASAEQVVRALQDFNSGFGNNNSAFSVWLSNPMGAPRGWQEELLFCSPNFAKAF